MGDISKEMLVIKGVGNITVEAIRNGLMVTSKNGDKYCFKTLELAQEFANNEVKSEVEELFKLL